MSKELEALHRLISFDKSCEFVPQQLKDDFAFVEEALTKNEKTLQSIREYVEFTLTKGVFKLKDAKLLLSKEENSEVAMKRVQDMLDITDAIKLDLLRRLDNKE